LRNHLLAPVRIDPGQPLAADLDQHHRTIGHHHRPFRKFQIGGENADIGHEILPACALQADFRLIPHAQHFVAHVYDKVAIACQAGAAQRSPAVARRPAN
jgi:hypothetical protein